MEGSRVKILLDTSVYIPFINDGVAHPALRFDNHKPLLYMSAVVIEELYAGALDAKTVKLLDSLYRTFHSLGRMIAPESSDWRKAGQVIASLGKKYGFEQLFLSRITHDALIALSAKRLGAVVVTNNTKDYLRIREFVDFKLSA